MAVERGVTKLVKSTDFIYFMLFYFILFIYFKFYFISGAGGGGGAGGEEAPEHRGRLGPPQQAARACPGRLIEMFRLI